MSALALTAVLWLSGSPDTALEQFHPPVTYESDRLRTAMVATGWSLFGLNATLTPVVTVLANFQLDCESHCHASSSAPWLTSLPMVFTPSLPRWAVGDVKGALLFTGLRAASWTTAAILEKRATEASFAVFLAAYAVPFGLGLADLVTAPHKEDLTPAPAGVQLTGLAPSPLVSPTGVHGASLQAIGVF